MHAQVNSLFIEVNMCVPCTKHRIRAHTHWNWGICFGNLNYGVSGGHAKHDQWIQSLLSD